MVRTDQNSKRKICLLGASFDTGNLGVSALAEASIKCILNRWPDAEITLLAASRTQGRQHLNLMGNNISVDLLPVRFCRNLLLPNHFCRLFLYALLLKLFPWKRFENALKARNLYLRRILESHLVCDITGGDSFSDIYGMRRFLLGFLRKWLVIILSRKLVMLPQTYGPYKRLISKMLARYVLNHASLVYSRDYAGLELVRRLLKNRWPDGKLRFAPDVAFILDPRKPQHIDIGSLEGMRTEETVVVGINISGLLINGGYTQNNMFGLQVDYRKLLCCIIESLLQNNKAVILLVPHVFPKAGLEIESDPDACRQVYESLRGKYRQRIFLVRSEYNHSQIKYIIGMCDFFIGSRMHAGIDAMSQCIPTVGLAYSRKFQGVFQTLGMEQFVVDMRHNGQEEILAKVTDAFEHRKAAEAHLKVIIPQIQKQILNIFKDQP